jgi:uncharacterized protein
VHIEELSKIASLNFLIGRRFGRLACASNLQPYITPFTFVYHENFLYSFGTVGQKINWMRANPLVCVEVDEIVDPAHWTSVIINAKFEELVDIPDGKLSRALAFKLLQKENLWWEPGYVKTIIHGEQRPMEPVYFRLFIEDITGHKSVHDEAQSRSQ